MTSPRKSPRATGQCGFLHVGDYDPSGVHLFSALDEDVRGFLTRLNPDARVVSERVAILPEHVERFQLQPARRRPPTIAASSASATIRPPRCKPRRWPRTISLISLRPPFAVAGTKTPPTALPT
jgi:hypothetical protein